MPQRPPRLSPPRVPDLVVPDAFQRETLLSLDAVRRADVRAALDHYLAGGPVRRGLPQERHMEELLDLGDEAPGWAWSRWAAHSAYRWLLITADRRIDYGVIATLDALYPDLDPFAMDPDELRERGTGLAANNLLVEQLALHEVDGLVTFLLAKRSPALLDRCDGVRRWGRAPMRAYRLAGTRRDRLIAQDMTDGEVVELLNVGALCDRDDGEYVLGRAVPTRVRPGRLFATRPFDIDAVTARAIGRLGKESGLGWLDALRDGVDAGRVDPMAFWNQSTPLSSDVVYEPVSQEPEDRSSWPGRKKELVAAGVSPAVADGVLVCEVGIIGVTVSGESVGAAMPHIAAVLSNRAVFEAALRHTCRPDTADAWATIADLVPEPARSRCLALSEAARRAA